MNINSTECLLVLFPAPACSHERAARSGSLPESPSRISTNSRFNVDRLWSVTVIPFRCCQLLAEGTGSGRALAPFREIQLHVCRRNNIAAETREGCNEHFTIKTKCTTSRCYVSSHGSLASCSIPQFNPTSLSQLCYFAAAARGSGFEADCKSHTN